MEKGPHRMCDVNGAEWLTLTCQEIIFFINEAYRGNWYCGHVTTIWGWSDLEFTDNYSCFKPGLTEISFDA